MSDAVEQLEKELAEKLPNVEVHTLGVGAEAFAGQPVLKALMISSRGSNLETAESAQLNIEPDSQFGGTAAGIIEPPFDPAVWALSGEQNTRLARAANAWARNTVGLGWKIVPKDPEGNVLDVNQLSAKDAKVFERERIQLQDLLKMPNRQMPFTKIMYLDKWDEEMTGNGYLEVVRNLKGRITSLYHIPSYSMRILKQDRGLVQVRGHASGTNGISFSNTEPGEPNFRFFKWFGDDKTINKHTGKPGDGRLGMKNRATEIIQFKLHTPRSTKYGAPRFVATAPAIAGNRLASERNVAFFENDAVPRGILFVEGGHLDAESVQRIEKFVRIGAQGVENAGRLLVLQLESKRTAMGNEANQSMKFQPLTVGVTEDASFLKYRMANDEEIREAFGLAESFFSTQMVNRSSAEIGRATTNEQEFEPDRLDKEFILNHTIVTDDKWEGGPMTMAAIEFRRPEIADPVDRARVLSLYSSAGALSPNDLRRELGKDPFPEEFEFANMPLAWGLAEMQQGLVGHLGSTGDPVVDDAKRASSAQADTLESQAKMAKKAEKQPAEGEEAPAKSDNRQGKKGSKNPDKRVGGASQQNLRPERTATASAKGKVESVIDEVLQDQQEISKRILDELEEESKLDQRYNRKGGYHY